MKSYYMTGFDYLPLQMSCARGRQLPDWAAIPMPIGYGHQTGWLRQNITKEFNFKRNLLGSIGSQNYSTPSCHRSMYRCAIN
eukprot:scaffold135264_cov28-Prasinocladus_malaysianus.AAC.1